MLISLLLQYFSNEQLLQVHEEVASLDYDWTSFEDRLQILSGIRRQQKAIECAHVYDLCCVRDSLMSNYTKLQNAREALENHTFGNVNL